MEQTPLPTTIPEVEQLILALYQPQNTPAAIANIQDVLQCLQKSPQGWQVAKQLLDQPSRGNQDDQIRFFGALTIIIKLNTERHVPHSSLTDDDAQELLQSLLQWLISAATGGSGALVVQKLCHALVSFFVQFSHLWPNCVRHVLVCLNEKRNVPLELVPQPSEVPQLARTLPWELLRAIPSFLAKLVEDVGKTDMNAIKHTSTHRRLIENAQDATALLSVCLAPPLSNQDHVEAIKKETLDCIQSWIFYAQRVSSNTEELVTPLRTLVEPTINCLANESSYQAAVELLTEVLSNYSRFFTEDQYAMLASIFESQWAQQLYNRLTAGDYDDVDVHPLMFGLFMIAYGDAKVLELMQSPDQRSQQFLSGLCGLLGTRGYPVAEDKIFVPALEFWSTFIETMTDSLYSDEDAAKVWRHTALAHVMQVVGACWKKIQYPSMDTFLSWDSSERAGFGDARKDVADLLQTTYSISGQDLISLFVDLLLQSLPTKSWAEIEAAAFCLSSLSDCISDEGNCDDLLSRVFSAPLFDLLSQNQGPIPVKLRQTALSLIERYSEYFERRSEYLPAALSLLFDAVGVANLAGPSSKSIATLCSSCRSTLTSEAGAFLGHYQTLHTMQNLDPLAEERIVAAIASIIQAIPEETRRLQAFEQLFGLLRTDINRCIQLLHKPGTANTEEPLLQKGFTQCQPKDGQAPGVNEVLLQIVHLSMRCLASMAKGMQATSDGPVDLEADSPGKKASPSQHLLHVQSQVMALMVEVQSAFPKSGEVVDTICNAMKAGFSETEPGPFVFQPEMVSEFFTRQRFETPRIGVLVSTACCFVSALSTYPKEQVKQNLTTLLPWVVSLLHSLPEPDADTELAQNGIDFVSRLMNKHPEVLFQIQPTSMLEFFFMFTLKVLNGQEPLPKASSADFWTSFITLRSADAGLQSSIDGAMEHLGPLLAQALVQNIGGGASRSELDRLSDPLKKLVVSHVRAQSWLERALADPSFPSDKVSAQDKSVFLKRIVKNRLQIAEKANEDM